MALTGHHTSIFVSRPIEKTKRLLPPGSRDPTKNVLADNEMLKMPAPALNHAQAHPGIPSLCSWASKNTPGAKWPMVDGPITECDNALRQAYGVRSGVSIMNYLSVKHSAMPVVDPMTILAIEGPPRQMRQSAAGRKPRRKPGLKRTYNVQVCDHCKAIGTIEVDTVHAELICKECCVVIGKSDASFDYHDQEHMLTAKTPGSSGQSYDNANHFRDTLLQVQGLEPMKLDNVDFEKKKSSSKAKPAKMLERMREYMEINRIEPTTLTPSKTYHILKDLKLPSLYKHKVKITYMLSGNPPTIFSSDQITKLCEDFQKIQAPIRKSMLVRGRKNIPSYMYILFKLCEMYKWYDVCRVCYLLKTNCKLNKLDEIWKDVCEELKSEDFVFIPSPTFSTHHK